MRQLPASDSSLLVTFGDSPTTDCHAQVLALFETLRRINDPRIRNLHPAYSSLLIDFEPLRIGFREIQAIVRSALEQPVRDTASDRTVEIPVCYGEEMGPDLEVVARLCGLHTEEVVSLHSAAAYEVSFLGFSPGFPYLSGLVPRLETPRRSTPRTHVPAGSVGIAGSQTGVYPLDSPGGWQIIGRTPLKLFDWRRRNPTLLAAGDRVRFVSITKNEFLRIQSTEGES